MPTFKSFEEIESWQKARELTREVYTVSNQAPLQRISVCVIKFEEQVFRL